MPSQRSVERSVRKDIAKRELTERKKIRWSLSTFMDDKKCPPAVKDFVLKKFVTETLC